ncbi:hypothetical protein [Streptomyces sp. AF1A]|uniref:hypothetical protein n=1 Tax=Streptomyces sp. AF1A TaxID=3394350 RepID=UPI0039BD8C08
MNSALRDHRYGRALGAGVMSAALLSGTAAGASAATSKPTPKPVTSSPTMRPRMVAAAGSISVSADHKAVKAGDTVAFTGRVKGVKSGSTLVLQHQHNGKWTTLRTTAVVNKNGTYTIKRKFTDKGTEQVRVATKDGTFTSSPVTVKVS